MGDPCPTTLCAGEVAANEEAFAGSSSRAARKASEGVVGIGTCSGNPSGGLVGDDSFARSTPLGFGPVRAASASTRVGLTDRSAALGVFGAIFGGVLGSSFPDALGTCPAAFGASLVDAAFGTSFTGVLEDFFFLTRVVERNRGCGIMMVMISTFFQDDDSQHFLWSLNQDHGW